MIVKDKVIQGSEEWLALRRGRPTASQFSRILTPKGAPSASRFPYMDELIAECFFPELIEFAGNSWTDRGTELEPEARAAFTAASGREVVEVGFCTRDDRIVGCSPDGLITDAAGEYVAGLEIKCPAPKTHVGYMRQHAQAVALGGEWFPSQYKLQVHGGIAVTGLDRWHFFSYCPGLSPLHLIVKRDAFTGTLTKSLDKFLIEYGEMRERLIPKLVTTEGDDE